MIFVTFHNYHKGLFFEFRSYLHLQSEVADSFSRRRRVEADANGTDSCRSPKPLPPGEGPRGDGIGDEPRGNRAAEAAPGGVAAGATRPAGEGGPQHVQA